MVLAEEWNDTSRLYDLEVTLQDRIESQARRTPDDVAVIFEGRELTYKDLNRRANQLANRLRRSGVGPDSLVGLYLERSLELVIGLVGVLKAGGAYVPLDPDYPAERVEFMLRDAQVPVILTLEKCVGALPASNCQVVCLDTDRESIAEEPDSIPPGLAEADNLAYVIYTSGSTGRPKGAMISHRAICNRLLWMQDEYRLTGEDTVFQKTPFSFDVSVWEFFWPLITGARMVLARPGGHKDGSYLADVIAEHHVTVMHFVPSMLRSFLEVKNLERCSSLRDVICSGEVLPHELQQRFFERLDADLHNLYGPTEAAVDVTFWRCERDGSRKTVPIGRPIANTQIHLLDADLRPVPIGAPGELYIGGVQVARGYLNRPELTEERFISDPFSSRETARLYKTGDLAKLMPDGSIEFIGRTDYQVKVRGFRIELGEIESELASHPGVDQAVVLARQDLGDNQSLVAYVSARGEQTRTLIRELRELLRRRVPDYMLPSAFVVLDEMPLTPNGKVDRSALPDVSRERPALEREFVPPSGALEQYLAELWREILQLDCVGTDDPFFELGGDSLLAAQFIRQVQEKLGAFIYVMTIFEAPTIARYADLLRADHAESVATSFGPEEAPAAASAKVSRRVDLPMIEDMRRHVPCRVIDPNANGEGEKNPSAMFILAPPRSGTTLLRMMLAGHPRLFSASELNLLSFNTLQERRAAFTGKYAAWMEGTIRMLMETRQCDAREAKRAMEAYETRGLTTKQLYRVLQEEIGDRTLVDKSPAYALDPGALRKAESEFDEPLYIHLVRHPYATVRSFEDMRIDRVLFLRECPYSTRELGELVWTVSHMNIAEFLETVPQHRQVRLRFEDLTSTPKEVMESACERLGVEFDAGVLSPYADMERKMTDGIYASSDSMGDPKFLRYRGIERAPGESWKGVENDDFLGDMTWSVAESFGYACPEDSTRQSRRRAESQNRLRRRERRQRHRERN